MDLGRGVRAGSDRSSPTAWSKRPPRLSRDGLYAAPPSRRLSRRGGGRQVPGEHGLDLRGTRATVETVDDALPLDEHERGHVRDPELLRQLGLVLDGDAHDPYAGALLARKVGEQALH